ncbi:MAG: TolC family protein [Pirellulales bacterium]
MCVLLGQIVSGCGLRHADQHQFHRGKEDDMAYYRHVALEIEYPDVESTVPDAAVSTMSPLDIHKEQAPDYWDLHLSEVMELALANATVMRDLSGVVLRSTSTARTVQSVAITETDPRFGTDAALSAFDALFQYSATWEKNDRALNNTFFGGGTRILQQDLGVYQAQLSKRTAFGTQLAARHYTDYDANNAPGNAFPHAYNVNIETEVRQPLLQGGGLNYNRIVGPNGIPGQFSGVMLARVNTDISLTDFEMGVRDLTSNVENAYWDLYLAYRYLYAATQDRDRALEYWRNIHAQLEAGREGVDAAIEAAARERYFQAEEDVQNAWSGRLLDGTRVNNGSSGGTLRSSTTIRGSDGIRVAERRLRLMIGLPISDGRLIRPADEPPMTKVLFEWSDVVCEALNRRAELRRQKWLVKRRELELAGARNFLLPTFDAFGRYRWRGFGNDLIDPNRNGIPFDNAYQTLTGGDFQEWQLGFEFSYYLGNRKGHVTVRNAEIQLARERTILHEQEREVIHDLSNQVAESARAYDVAQLAYNRRMAAKERMTVEQTNYDTGVEKQPDRLLEAQRQFNEVEARFYISLIEYALAVKNVHYEKGSLLDYNEITLAEGGWPMKAYRDASERERRRLVPERLNYVMQPKQVVTRGPIPQQIEGMPEQLPPPPEHLPAPTPPPDAEKPGADKPEGKPAAPADKAADDTVDYRPSSGTIELTGAREPITDDADGSEYDRAPAQPLPVWPVPEDLPPVDSTATILEGWSEAEMEAPLPDADE